MAKALKAAAKSRYLPPHKDAQFRRWLEEHNIVPAYLFAFGTPSLIGKYRKAYNATRQYDSYKYVYLKEEGKNG